MPSLQEALPYADDAKYKQWRQSSFVHFSSLFKSRTPERNCNLGSLLWGITLAIFENNVLTLIKCFLSTVGLRNLKTQQSPLVLDLCLRTNRAGKSHDNRFWKVSFSTCFSSTVKRKAGVFKFLRFEMRLRKAPFLWRIYVDGRLNPRSKAGVFKILRRRRCSRCFLSASSMSSDVWRNNFL